MSDWYRKPCPFCGESHQEHLHLDDHITGSLWRVRCDTCFVFGPPEQTQHEAIEAWNARKESAAVFERLIKVCEAANQAVHEILLPALRKYEDGT